MQTPINSRNSSSQGQTSTEDKAPANYSKRILLYSVENAERLAFESFRVKRIEQQSKPRYPCARDFTASFRGSSKNSSDPSYVASHTSPVPVPCRRHIMPGFPVMQPFLETSSAEDLQVDDLETNTSFRCRCENCAKPNCPSKRTSSTTTMPMPRSSPRRNNIMTFSDRCTMTVSLADVSCGLTPVSSQMSQSGLSAAPSEIAVRDTGASIHIDQLTGHLKYPPVPILRSNRRNPCGYNDENAFVSYTNAFDYNNPSKRTYHLPERDNPDESRKRLSVTSIKSFFKCRKKKKIDGNRRVIYNQGISDWTRSNWPVMPMTMPSSTNVSRCCSRSTFKGRDAQLCTADGQIPYSHRTNSRYHKSCKTSNTKTTYYGVEEPLVNPKPVWTSSSRMLTCNNVPYIRLPKRVLTSERDIDSFVNLKKVTITPPPSPGGRHKWC